MAALDTSNALAGDSRSLDALRRQAKESPKEAVRQAATQFEALFMNMLMKSMRDSLPKEDVMGSESARTYTGMLDQQLAQKLSGKGLGLADMMVKQLERNQKAAPGKAAGTSATPALADKLRAANTEAARAGDSAASAPQAFVNKMVGEAREVARESGIPAHFMLGQAALETGWGKREIRAADGSNSHNLFGIKATRDWKGSTVDAVTTEYVNGVPRKQVEKFRAYASYADSFRDYAKLVSKSPRYAEAARETGSAAVFAQRIQSAGYATDPAYAEKLTRVINRTLAMQPVA